MAELFRILRESFQLLFREPKLFLPKLVSAVLSSLWLLGLISGELNYLYAVVTLPLIGFLGVFVSVMVAAMVKYRGEDRLLLKGLAETSSKWKPVFAASIFFLVSGFIVSLPLSIGLYFYYFTKSVVPLVAGGATTLIVVLALSFFSYFVPITLYEEKSFLSGLKSSALTSTENVGDIAALTLFSFAMLGVATFTGSTLEVLGAVGFLIGRLVSSVVGTYLFVVSPKYYLEG